MKSKNNYNNDVTTTTICNVSRARVVKRRTRDALYFTRLTQASFEQQSCLLRENLFNGMSATRTLRTVFALIVGTVSLVTPREWQIWGSIPACAGIFLGRVILVTSTLALQWLPCQAPGVIGSALGLVGPASVYCDWARQKV